MSFWDVVWLIIISFAFFAYLIILFTIVSDLFRDRDTSGWVKAVWIVALIFLPFLAALVYLIARGGGMAERSMQQAQDAAKRQEAYIRDVAGGGGGGASPADQIARAKELLDQGAITQDEFATIKAKALA